MTSVCNGQIEKVEPIRNLRTSRAIGGNLGINGLWNKERFLKEQAAVTKCHSDVQIRTEKRLKSVLWIGS